MAHFNFGHSHLSCLGLPICKIYHHITFLMPETYYHIVLVFQIKCTEFISLILLYFHMHILITSMFTHESLHLCSYSYVVKVLYIHLQKILEEVTHNPCKWFSRNINPNMRPLQVDISNHVVNICHTRCHHCLYPSHLTQSYKISYFINYMIFHGQ